MALSSAVLPCLALWPPILWPRVHVCASVPRQFLHPLSARVAVVCRDCIHWLSLSRSMLTSFPCYSRSVMTGFPNNTWGVGLFFTVVFVAPDSFPTKPNRRLTAAVPKFTPSVSCCVVFLFFSSECRSLYTFGVCSCTTWFSFKENIYNLNVGFLCLDPLSGDSSLRCPWVYVRVAKTEKVLMRQNIKFETEIDWGICCSFT